MRYDTNGIAFKRLNLPLENGIMLFAYGYEDFKHRASIPRNRKLHNHILQFVVQGEGQYSISEKIYHLQKNSLFYLPPNTPLKYQRNKNNPYKYFWITLQGKNVKKLVNSFGLSTESPVRQIEDETLANAFMQLSDMNLSMYTIKGICYTIFGQLLKQAESESVSITANSLGDMSERLKEYILTNFSNTNLSVLDIADALNLSEMQLYRLSKTTFGSSTKKYILKCRMEHAKKLLRAGYNVTATSMYCGFSDVYYFSKEFKKYHGVSPSQYK